MLHTLYYAYRYVVVYDNAINMYVPHDGFGVRETHL